METDDCRFSGEDGKLLGRKLSATRNSNDRPTDRPTLPAPKITIDRKVADLIQVGRSDCKALIVNTPLF